MRIERKNIKQYNNILWVANDLSPRKTTVNVVDCHCGPVGYCMKLMTCDSCLVCRFAFSTTPSGVVIVNGDDSTGNSLLPGSWSSSAI